MELGAEGGRLIVQADARRIPLAEGSVHMCVTSPPYWGLRDYGVGDSGIGLEKTPEEYVANIVAVFREVWRVLRDDGTLWLNLGDCYGRGTRGHWAGDAERDHKGLQVAVTQTGNYGSSPDAPAKQLMGIPWRVAFALQADGWYLRSDIVWAKPNPMPESVTDRPTKSHEYLFLLSKRPRYYYDAEAIREPSQTDPKENYPARARVLGRGHQVGHGAHPSGPQQDSSGGYPMNGNGRNRRDVWTIPTSPFKGAHFATFPPKLVEPCVLAGTSAKGVCPECGAPWERITETTYRNDTTKDGRPAGGGGVKTNEGGMVKNISGGQRTRRIDTTLSWRPTCDHGGDPVPGVVLDPFCGSGTVGQVCRENGRRFVGLDLSMKYLHELAYKRAELGQMALA